MPVVVVIALALTMAACGQKGPPLAPLHLVPSPPTEVSARRIAEQVRVRLVLPNTNANGPGPIQLDRVEIYAITVAPGVTPPNRVLLTRQNVVGRIVVRPPLAEGEEPKEGDTRPEPGTPVFFDEPITPATLEPVDLKLPEPPKPAATAPAPAVPAPAPAPAPTSTDPVRIYVVRGVTKSGRTGPQSPRVAIPLIALPTPPTDLSSRMTESTVLLQWKPPADADKPLSFNVYRADEPLAPLNPSPLTASTFEYADVKFGEEFCFRVRSVVVLPSAGVEGDLSDAKCVTPTDVFPPAAPKKPDAVATQGQISLIWDANTEKDVAGYLVLRGEGPDAALKPLTPQPIRDTSFRDTTVQPGVRYVYAIVAVDTATPANTSPPSPPVEETAR